ncbi:MAG: lipoyl synthase [candidate division WOR-3 bacterium]|nr:lipoyl synthase [candidate division WOR-3 bacterium]
MSLPKEYRTLLKRKHIDTRIKGFLDSKRHIHTICNEALCPNRGECFSNSTATFLIMGDICTRNCAFCAVKSGSPGTLDRREIDEMIEAIRLMGLDYIVITSVTRDDIEDGGAGYFNETAARLKSVFPDLKIEMLVPDFRQDLSNLSNLGTENIDVFNHNLETVPGLYKRVRTGADYTFSLSMLKRAKDMGFITKTGIMLGLGETIEEIDCLFEDIAGYADILTIGQYIKSDKNNAEVVHYYTADDYSMMKDRAIAAGVNRVVSGVFVRSSYKAKKTYEELKSV